MSHRRLGRRRSSTRCIPGVLTFLLAGLLLLSATLVAASAPLPVIPQEQLDYEMLGKIRDEGLNRSQVMEHLSWLTDVYGPRLTGSPAIEQAKEWAMERFREWGLANVHEERFSFGKGWSIERFSAHMLEPQVMPIIGYPRSWSPSTDGVVSGDVVYVEIDSENDFERYRGELEGKIVLMQPAREIEMLGGDLVLRMNDELFAEAERMPIPEPRAGGRAGGGRGGGQGGPSLRQRIDDFLLEEDVAVLLDRGSDRFMVSGGSDLSWTTQRTDGGTLFVGGGGPRDDNAGNVVPSATIAVEHYNRMIRIMEKGLPVRMEIEVRTRFHDESAAGNAFNLLAEIPGTDLAHEVVMIGAHFDSTHASVGATDNASGNAAMMEAMRILMAVGAQPRRTIRIGLWGAEEQGLIGSREYVRRHFGDPQTMQLQPAHADFSAYFNIDNGTGRIRGVWLQENLAVRPIFEQWIEPLRDLGVTTLGPRSVGGTDHGSFDAVGLPAFQFMQDRLEYNSRTHHSNMDFYDRVQPEDMVQMATVAAVFAYNAAMRDEKLPRKALPEPRRR